MGTMPTRIDQALFAAAEAAGELHSRSAAQQLDHWARIGRGLETSPSVSHEAISRVLAGQMSYDDLGDRAQAMVRASWDEQIAARIDRLDLSEQLRGAGRPWPEADADGRVIERDDRSAHPGA